ncbi:alpha-2-macroglobulin [Aquimarina hainanensis]|uniref:Alpha-2-macroglobulin n=1 Tax=Aquimarina hainanensis TaxID=1578017 RepID=A0ABW5N6E4_9FLAO
MNCKQINAFLIALVLLISCKNSDQKKIENLSEPHKYEEYISQVSTGVISAYDKIQVILQNPIAGWSDHQELSNDIIEISPAVKGKLIAVNNRTLSFEPEEKLAQDTFYTFTLDLEKLGVQVTEDLSNDFVFGVRTLEQQFSVFTDHIQSYDKKWQYVEGTITSSDQLQIETVRQLVNASQKGKQLSIDFEDQAVLGREFVFRIDSIQRFDKDSEVKLVWSGDSFNIDSEGEDLIKIPGKDNFSVLAVDIADTEEKYIEINFSDPLQKNQNFNGLVTISGVKNLRYTVDRNILKVYPKSDPVGMLEVMVFQGIKSEDGYKIKETYKQRVSFQQPNPELRLLQSGVILPTSDDLKFNFEAINLRAVEVEVVKIYKNNVLQFLQSNNLGGASDIRSVGRPIARKLINLQNNKTKNLSKWNAFAIDLKELIVPDLGAVYRVELTYKKEYSLYKCNGVVDTSPLKELEDNFDEENKESSYWDSAQYYYDYNYDYNWRDRNDPCTNSYYYDKKVGANILASNLGVVVKKGANNSCMIAVNDIITTNPVSNAKVQLFNYQQQEVAVGTTDAEGMVIIDAESAAFFAIVTSGKQQTYVKLNDGNALSVSKFDVAGAKLKKGIKGFIYGERGVWRPGDTIFLSFMLNDNANKLPENHPVKLELRDPYGKLVHQETKTTGVNNFYAFEIITSEEDPTGNWNAKIAVGGASFNKQLKIETIKPNRLKIKTTFENEVLKNNTLIKGGVEVLWLHGAVARNLKADVTARFSAKKTNFSTFPGYVFDDPTREFGTEEQEVFKGNISSEGKASFDLRPVLHKKAAGKLNASFVTKVYENGGDFSTDVISKEFSPYEVYVGLNTPKGDKARGMLLTDTPHKFEVVSVDDKGKIVGNRELEVRIYKVNWKWWWDTSEDNLSSYNGSSYHTQIFKKNVTTGNNGKATFHFELKYPEWGRYLVRVVDTKGGHATGKTMYIDWPGWAGKSRKNDPSAATMLLFSTDKDSYKVGEKATITFPSSLGGRALVTVENGTEVLNSFWVSAKKEETKFELPIEAIYTPNVYIHITLLQPHAFTQNDLPIRLYGVVPIAVEDPATRIVPTLKMPSVLRPEETIEVKVGEEKGKEMTYAIAIVDDGLLDLTRFKTPNPWDTFYAKEALGVKTWDVYDDVIGAYGGSINQIFSIGGDAEAGGSKSKKANRFKPMVVYLGPFELEKGKTKTHTIKMPKYIGSVRTMVVASDAENAAYGSVEKTTPVRKPLMVLTSVPRKITPGERVTVPVTVFAMENKIKDVTVSIKPQAGFTVVGETTKKISFPNPDEKMVYFDIEVLPGVRATNIEVIAAGNGAKSSYNTPIKIVNPNPVTTEVTSVVLEPNSEKSIDIASFGIADSNKVVLEFSSIPPMNFESRLQYLIQYPHGCVEQTTSSVFPQLFVGDIFDLSSDQKHRVQKNVETAIDKIKRYIRPDGGLSYWPGATNANDWGTTYAGHFLLEASKKGYVLPIGFKNNWVRYQQRVARQWRRGGNDLAQAYRLYTLALAGRPDLASMNRLRETKNISYNAGIRLIAAYALIGQKVIAEDLLKEVKKPKEEKEKNNRYTYGSKYRNKAMVLETKMILQDKIGAKEIADQLAQALSADEWMSTQTTAYVLQAMSKYVLFVGGKGVKAQYVLNGISNSISSSKTMTNTPAMKLKKMNALSLKNSGENTVFVQIANSGVLEVGKEKVLEQKIRTIIDYKDKKGSNIAVEQLSQGTDFVAEVTITNTTHEEITNVALSEMFPSGWEIVNTRFTEYGIFRPSEATYTDIRDDRVHFYFDLKAQESKTFTILLNASYIGRYYLPGVQSEAMYNNSYMSRTKGKWVEVVQ